MHTLRSKFSAYSVYLTFSGAFSLASALIGTVNMVYQVEVARLNPLQLVLVGTTLEVVAFLFQVPTGILADVYSRRLAVIAGVVLYGLAFILEGSFPVFDVILAVQVLFGIGAVMIDGAEQAWITGEVGDERAGHVFLRSTQAGLLGELVGAILSVAIASYRLNLAIVLGGVMSVLIGVYLLLFMPEQHFRPATQDELPSWKDVSQTFRNGVRVVRTSSVLLTILLIALFFGLYSEGVDRLSTAHLLADYHIPALWQFQPVVWFGVISVATTLLTLLASEIVRRRVDTARQRALIRAQLIANVAGIVSLLVFALAGNFFLALAALLSFNIYRSVNTPLFNTWFALNTDPKVRATVFSMSGQVDAIGQIAGGPPVGYIGTLFSLRAALVASSIILSPVLLLFAYASRKVKRAGEQLYPVEKEEDIAPVV
jgi:DHA3 family tetracycline resistance protein-like MFS transporter